MGLEIEFFWFFTAIRPIWICREPPIRRPEGPNTESCRRPCLAEMPAASRKTKLGALAPNVRGSSVRLSPAAEAAKAFPIPRGRRRINILLDPISSSKHYIPIFRPAASARRPIRMARVLIWGYRKTTKGSNSSPLKVRDLATGEDWCDLIE